jgi:hypothetical protein
MSNNLSFRGSVGAALLTLLGAVAAGALFGWLTPRVLGRFIWDHHRENRAASTTGTISLDTAFAKPDTDSGNKNVSGGQGGGAIEIKPEEWQRLRFEHFRYEVREREGYEEKIVRPNYERGQGESKQTWESKKTYENWIKEIDQELAEQGFVQFISLAEDPSDPDPVFLSISEDYMLILQCPAYMKTSETSTMSLELRDVVDPLEAETTKSSTERIDGQMLIDASLDSRGSQIRTPREKGSGALATLPRLVINLTCPSSDFAIAKTANPNRQSRTWSWTISAQRAGDRLLSLSLSLPFQFKINDEEKARGVRTEGNSILLPIAVFDELGLTPRQRSTLTALGAILGVVGAFLGYPFLKSRLKHEEAAPEAAAVDSRRLASTNPASRKDGRKGKGKSRLGKPKHSE